jgi:hypothetical protein
MPEGSRLITNCFYLSITRMLAVRRDARGDIRSHQPMFPSWRRCRHNATCTSSALRAERRESP